MHRNDYNNATGMRIWLSLLLGLPLAAAEGDELFEKQIRPVLAEKCFGCHSANLREPKAGLRLDTKAGLRSVNGKLLKAISYTDLHLRMPPAGKLSDDTIESFAAWLKLGALDPRVDDGGAGAVSKGIDLERGRGFWAFQPLRGGDAGIDQALAKARASKGLTAAARAGRREWLRRVTFDLTGLPPSTEEMDRFLKGEPYGAAVDRLLASPHYGERWARHWLDLVRYAETNGHEYDNNKLDAWRYRDYVIRAFNDDLRYDRFVQEHIAGDLLRDQRLSRDGKFFESPLATNFYWFGEVLNSATDSIKSKADTVDNQIDVIGKAFLGLTVACARCHDHKFDPIPTKDYYGLAGILHSTGMREVVIDSPAQAAAVRAAHVRAAPVTRNPGKTRIALRPGETMWEDFEDLAKNNWYASGEAFANGVRDGIVDSAGRGVSELVGSLTSKKFRMPNHYVHVRLAATKGDRSLGEREPVRLTLVADDFKSLHYLGTGKDEFEWVTYRMTLPYQRLCYFEIVDRSRTGAIAVDAIVFSEEKDPPPVENVEKADWREPASVAAVPESAFGMVAWDEAPGDTKLHIRGSHVNLGEDVPRHFLQVLSKQQAPLTGSGRVEMARWITGDARDLLARVWVNRVWKHHFGDGLARTTDNFGLTGERPVHRDLLDSLTARFVANGWSTKKLHREIVLSDAYKMSSRADAAMAKIDPRNEYLHHYPVRRLEAEAIRDAILFVSGGLNAEMYGPSVVPYISKYQDGRGKPRTGPLDGAGRRSLYVQVRRNFLTPLFLAFDYPLPISTIGARNQSTVPSQALMMMNNEFVLQQAALFAERMAGESDKTGAMYRRAFGREPSAQERNDAHAFLAGGGTLADFAHVLFNSAEFIYVQ